MSDHSPPGLPSTPEIDTTVSHSARVWDYWLGGKDSYPVDQKVGDQIAHLLPEIVQHARVGRLFLGRAVRYLASEQGIRQFLDIGTGLPTADNTHEVAQRVAPEARVVYVDNDPLVLAHAQALLTSTPEGAAEYVYADLRDPKTIIAEARRTLDFTQPVAITMLGILWHITDDDEAFAIIDELVDATVPGSYLAIAHPTIEVSGGKMAAAIEYWNQHGTPRGIYRSPKQIERFFHALDLVDPGVITCTRWRPEASAFGEPDPVDQYAAVGQKP